MDLGGRLRGTWSDGGTWDQCMYGDEEEESIFRTFIVVAISSISPPSLWADVEAHFQNFSWYRLGYLPPTFRSKSTPLTVNTLLVVG